MCQVAENPASLAGRRASWPEGVRPGGPGNQPRKGICERVGPQRCSRQGPSATTEPGKSVRLGAGGVQDAFTGSHGARGDAGGLSPAVGRQGVAVWELLMKSDTFPAGRVRNAHHVMRVCVCMCGRL